MVEEERKTDSQTGHGHLVAAAAGPARRITQWIVTVIHRHLVAPAAVTWSRGQGKLRLHARSLGRTILYSTYILLPVVARPQTVDKPATGSRPKKKAHSGGKQRWSSPYPGNESEERQGRAKQRGRRVESYPTSLKQPFRFLKPLMQFLP